MPKQPSESDPSTPIQFRLTKSILAMIDALAKRWGPIAELNRTQVVKEAIKRAHEAEFGPEDPPKKNPKRRT